MKFDKSYFRDILKPYAGYVEQSAQRLRTLLDTDEPTPSVSRKILVDGPVAGTYSLALVNRHFALALMRLGFDVYLTQREGPDPKTDVYFQSHPELAGKYIDRDEVLSLSFDVHTKNDWPIQESSRLAPILTAHCYAWEESVFPVSVTSELAKFDAIFCTSQYAIDALRCSGYIGPTYYMGNGVEHIEPERTGADRKKPRASRGVHFVHVSSGMPRKGMREGLAAFFEEFRDDKDVHLTIKTHYSFDNELYELVRNLGPEERSKITFDDSYMSPGAIRDLIASADCCFLPSHGEGFCLPAAEAMRLRTLVCTTDSGGNREFCTPDTCILIPTRFAPSKTAIGQGRSAWLQASRSDLRAGLRRAYTVCKSSDQSLQRRAYHRIRKFTWTRATQNFIAGIDTLLMERPPVTDQTSKKRICLISTFNQRCGIAAYSEDLYATMKKADVASTLIISENIAQELITKPDDSDVLRLWERTGEGIDRLVNYTSNNEMGSHFIIQHHPAIFSWRELTRLCEGLKSGSGIVVVELHSTDGDAHQLSEFIEKTSRYARIIVHSGIDYAKISTGLSDVKNIYFLPLSTSIQPSHPIKPKHDFSLFTFGFCCEHKRFEHAFAITRELKMRNRDVKLKLFSAIDGLSQNRIEYSNFLYMLRDQLGLREEIDLQFGFKPMSEILSAVRESNVALFCYADLTEGGSSALRIPLSCGVPTITSFSSIFSDLANICHQIDTQDAARAADLIEELVLDPDKMETAILKQTSYLDFSTWSKHFSRLDRMTDASSDRTKSGPHSYLEKVLSHH